jgi:hypothetical protein
MRREIGVAHHTNGTTNGADELQLSELIDEGTYGKVFKGRRIRLCAVVAFVCLHACTQACMLDCSIVCKQGWDWGHAQQNNHTTLRHVQPIMDFVRTCVSQLS